MTTNGISLRRLKTFLTNLKDIFAEKSHSHATSDITGLDNALSSKATAAQGSKADTAVQSVKIGDTEYKSGTTVTLPSYPTSLPAIDVPNWAKASAKPSYTKSEVGLGNVDNTADANKSVKYATTAGSAPANGGTATTISQKVDANSLSHTNYDTNGTYVPTMNFLSYWSGAYSSNGASNLAYCKHGALGTIVTKSASDYATANHTHSNYLTGITKAMVTTALGYTPPTTNTTYSVATTSSNGLMSTTDKAKLDGITTGANAVIKTISSADYAKLTDAQKKNGIIYLVN